VAQFVQFIGNPLQFLLEALCTTIYHTVLVFLAVLITTVTCYYSMVYSKVIVRYLGDSGKQIITKVFGLILAVISVQFVINGAANVLVDFGLFEIPGIEPSQGFEADE